MKRIATMLFGLLLLLTYASPSQACQWPPAPPVLCPDANYGCQRTGPSYCDTLLIDNCQNSAAVPFAALGDTVRGIGGIFTAVDSIPSGFSFYIQRTAPPNTPWCGVDAFTSGVPVAGNLGLKLGDSVLVYGKMAEFGGGTEIAGLSGSNPISVHKVGTASYPVPPFHVGTVHELNFLPVHSPVNEAEQWEGMLVRVPTSMRVVRHTGLGTTFIPGANCLVVDNLLCPPSHPASPPCDSLLIDTATLAGVSAPAVGGFVASVQGIFDQRGAAGQNSYEILIRKPEDINTNDPPHVVDAYCVANDTVRVVLDKAVTVATATDPFNYTYASLTEVHAAFLEADNKSVDLAIFSHVLSGVTDEVKVNSLEALGGSGPVMQAGEARNYIQGVQLITTIQGPNPDSLLGTPCEDVARFLGNNNGGKSVAGPGNISPDNPVRVTYRGVHTGVTSGTFPIYYTEQSGGGHRSGVGVLAPPTTPIRDHQYLIVAGIQEFPLLAQGLSETEMTGPAYMRDEGIPGGPAPAAVSIAEVNGVVSLTKLDPLYDKCTSPSAPATAEEFEGVLVKISNSKECGRTNSWGVRRTAGAGFTIAGPYPGCPDTVFVHGSGQGLTYQAADGAIVDVTGIMHLNFGTWEIYPRSDADIVELSLNAVDGSIPRTISFRISPNPAKVARLSFGLPREDRVELAVFDVAGRQVAMIEKGTLAAGSYTRAWDGHSDGGGTAGAGLYFYRLKVGNDVRTIHGVRLR